MGASAKIYTKYIFFVIKSLVSDKVMLSGHLVLEHYVYMIINPFRLITGENVFITKL